MHPRTFCSIDELLSQLLRMPPKCLLFDSENRSITERKSVDRTERASVTVLPFLGGKMIEGVHHVWQLVSTIPFSPLGKRDKARLCNHGTALTHIHGISGTMMFQTKASLDTTGPEVQRQGEKYTREFTSTVPDEKWGIIFINSQLSSWNAIILSERTKSIIVYGGCRLHQPECGG